MAQRHKKLQQTSIPKTQPYLNFKDIESQLEQAFAVLVLQCGSFCREIKDLLSEKLKINISHDWTLQNIQIPTVKEFKDATILMNQDLKSILSLVKILLYGKTPLTGLDSNEYKILKSCAALNELATMIDQSLLSNDQPSEYRSDLINLMKSLSDNIYSYQSSNTQFNDLMKEFATQSPSMNLTIPTSSMKSSRASERNSSSSLNNDLLALRRLLNQKQNEFEKNNQDFSICIQEYNKYIYELKDQISILNDQLHMLQKDRQELKQHNLVLLKNTGVLPQKINNSRMSIKNPSRRLTYTEMDERPSLRRLQVPQLRTSLYPQYNQQPSFSSMGRMLASSRK